MLYTSNKMIVQAYMYNIIYMYTNWAGLKRQPCLRQFRYHRKLLYKRIVGDVLYKSCGRCNIVVHCSNNPDVHLVLICEQQGLWGDQGGKVIQINRLLLKKICKHWEEHRNYIGLLYRYVPWQYWCIVLPCGITLLHEHKLFVMTLMKTNYASAWLLWQ